MITSVLWAVRCGGCEGESLYLPLCLCDWPCCPPVSGADFVMTEQCWCCLTTPYKGWLEGVGRHSYMSAPQRQSGCHVIRMLLVFFLLQTLVSGGADTQNSPHCLPLLYRTRGGLRAPPWSPSWPCWQGRLEARWGRWDTTDLSRGVLRPSLEQAGAESSPSPSRPVWTPSDRSCSGPCRTTTET